MENRSVISNRPGEEPGEGRLIKNEISYDLLAPKIRRDPTGRIIPHVHPPIHLTALDIYRLLKNHIQGRLMAQFWLIAPLVLFVLSFQAVILKQPLFEPPAILGGALVVIIGLMLIREGLKLGLMPLAEGIGHGLPGKSPLPVLLTILFLLGMGVPFAEPVTALLTVSGGAVARTADPVVRTLLNDHAGQLAMAVGGGIGLAVILGVLRFYHGWRLKTMLLWTVSPALGLSLFASGRPGLEPAVNLAWDYGAITMGPVTAPLLLSLGIGIAATVGKGNSPLSGFGLLALAAILPVIAILALSIHIHYTAPLEPLIDGARTLGTADGQPPASASTIGHALLLGLRALPPLALVPFLLLKGVLKEKMANTGLIIYGLFLILLGIILFHLGLPGALAAPGAGAGGALAATFTAIETVPASPLHTFDTGLALCLAYAGLVGFGATLAEPALEALGTMVENRSHGVFKKSTLKRTAALGAAIGIAIGLIRVIFELPLFWLLAPGYLLALLLTHYSSEAFIHIAWDGAGVITGPITVPLVLAMGSGVGGAIGSMAGFGLLSLAVLGCIIAILVTGLGLQLKNRAAAEMAAPEDRRTT